MYDPDLYRSKEEIERWKQHDPLSALSGRLKDAGLVNEADIEQLEQEVAEEIEDAITFAEAGTLEPMEELERFVYFEGVAP
jgi:TPP-dependent pyruvate/acetoin dehydrogenase alpha subunit